MAGTRRVYSAGTLCVSARNVKGLSSPFLYLYAHFLRASARAFK